MARSEWELIGRTERHDSLEAHYGHPDVQTPGRLLAPSLERTGHVVSDGDQVRLTDKGRRAIGQPIGSSSAPSTEVARTEPSTLDGPTGRRTFALGVYDRTKKYPLQWRAVPLDDLIASHGHSTLAPTPGFPQELQPRARETAATRSWLETESQPNRFSPTSLLTDTHELGGSAPIAGPDRIVESGNGRVMLLRHTRDTRPEVFATYQEALPEAARAVGIDPSRLTGMKDPVLVRENMSQWPAEGARAEFTKEANTDPQLEMSAGEKARSDARLVDAEDLAALVIPADGDISKALVLGDNHDWVTKIIGRLPPGERGGMYDRKGRLSPDGVKRIKNAIFARVFGGEAGLQLQANYMDSALPEEKAIGHAIAGALVDLAKLEGSVADGRTEKGLAIAEPLAEAVLLRTEAKATKQKLSDLVASRKRLPMLGDDSDAITQDLAVWIDKNVKRPAVLREALQEYARRALREPAPGQTSMFEGRGAKPATEVWHDAVSAVEENRGLAPTWRGSAPAEQRPEAPAPSGPEQTPPAAVALPPEREQPAKPAPGEHPPAAPGGGRGSAGRDRARAGEAGALPDRNRPASTGHPEAGGERPEAQPVAGPADPGAVADRLATPVSAEPPAAPPPPDLPGAGGIEPPSGNPRRDVHTVGAGYWATTLPDEAVGRFQDMLDEWAQYSRSGGVPRGEVFDMARALGVDPAWMAKTIERAIGQDTKLPAVESEALKLATLRAFADVETLQSQLRDLQAERARRGDPDGVLAADVTALEQALKTAQSTLELVGKAERRDVEGHARALAQQQFRVAAGAGADVVNRLTANVQELADLTRRLADLQNKTTLTEDDLAALRHLAQLLEESGVLLGGRDDQVSRILEAIRKALGEQGQVDKPPSKGQGRVMVGKAEDLAKDIKRQGKSLGESGTATPLADLAVELIRTNREQAHLRDQDKNAEAAALEPARQSLLARMSDLLRAQVLRRMQQEKAGATMLDVDRQLARGALAHVRRQIEEQMRYPQRDLAALQARLDREMQRALDREQVDAVLEQIRAIHARGRATFRAADVKQDLADMQPHLEALGAAGRARAEALREGLFKATLMRGTTDEERFQKLQAAQALVDPSNPEQVGAFLKVLREPGWLDHAQEAMVVNMLTSPQTWFLTGVNVTSNALQIGLRSMVMVPLSHGLGEARWLNAGMAHALPEGVARAREIMAQGYLADDVERAMMTGDWAQTRPELMGSVPYVGRAYRGWQVGRLAIPGLYHISTRPLNAMDVMQGHMLYAGSVAQLAYRRAGELLAKSPKGVRVPLSFGPEETVYSASPDGSGGYRARARSKLVADRQELADHVLRNLHKPEYADIKSAAGDIEDYYLLRKPLNRKGDISAEARIDAAMQRLVALRHAEHGASLGVRTLAMTAHLMLPFFKTSYNASKQMLSLSPPGIVYNAYRAKTAGDPHDRREALLKAVIGVGLMALAWYLQDQDLLTGDGPDDAGEYARWRRTHEPHSIFIGGKWRRLDNTVIGMPLIATANAFEDAKAAMAKAGRSPDAAYTDAAAAFAKGLMKGTAAAILGQSALRSVSDVGSAFEGKTTGQAMAANYASRLFPSTSMLRWAAQMGDPVQRDPKSFEDFLNVTTPWGRPSVPAKLNEWGEPLPNPRQGLAASLDPLRSVRPWGLDDPIIRKLDASAVTLPTAPGTVRNVPLTEAEQREFTLKAGPILKAELGKFVLSPGFDQMPTSVRQQAVDAITGPIRRSVGDEILTEMGNDEIARRLKLQTKTPIPSPERKAS